MFCCGPYSHLVNCFLLLFWILIFLTILSLCFLILCFEWKGLKNHSFLKNKLFSGDLQHDISPGHCSNIAGLVQHQGISRFQLHHPSISNNEKTHWTLPPASSDCRAHQERRYCLCQSDTPRSHHVLSHESGKNQTIQVDSQSELWDALPHRSGLLSLPDIPGSAEQNSIEYASALVQEPQELLRETRVGAVWSEDGSWGADESGV